MIIGEKSLKLQKDTFFEMKNICNKITTDYRKNNFLPQKINLKNYSKSSIANLLTYKFLSNNKFELSFQATSFENNIILTARIDKTLNVITYELKCDNYLANYIKRRFMHDKRWIEPYQTKP
ncbi:hypothetical protein AAEX28_06605 [Lentisphaerota bacterium WC36G]|nr:hypothetical protein LJT99_09470 [Lentisphaerae bacterium WC36]